MQDILRPICTAWKTKIDNALKHRQPWLTVARECKLFFSAAAGFMWDDKYKKEFNNFGGYAPTFKLTIAKAFELVALFGPSLYYRNPIRTVKPKPRVQITPEMFQFMPPMDQVGMEALMQSQAMESAQVQGVAQLISQWLNYTPSEQSGGGLKNHVQLAITDALVKGRGCLTVEPYTFPGSDTKITGAFYLDPYDLVIDPDAPSIWEAKWMAVRCQHPTWEVERIYGLQPGTLKDYADASTYNGVAETGEVLNREGKRIVGQSFDTITYWKVYSKGGIGMRLSGVSDDPLLQQLDEAAGDYCYLVIPEMKHDFPLNCKPEMLATATTEQLQQAFQWPIPYWRDGKWPIAILDFYQNPGCVWPIAPMQPGIGELQFINIMVSHLCNRIVNSSRDFVTCPQAIQTLVETTIKEGKDLAVLGFTQEMQDKPNGGIGFLQFPQVNMDAWMIIDRVSEMFDKRVGLSELLYGYNPGAASRTAEDAAMKRQALSVRPDHMASQVEDWMTLVAQMEHLCTQVFIGPQDVAPVLGNGGAMLWQSLISSRPIDTVLRDTQVTIEAGTARKPNRDRDAANITAAMQSFMPLLQQYAMSTGDVNPINNMLMQWSEANDFDVSGMMLQPPPPPHMPPMPGEGGPVPPEQGVPQ